MKDWRHLMPWSANDYAWMGQKCHWIYITRRFFYLTENREKF
jgi:hypothetical protein